MPAVHSVITAWTKYHTVVTEAAGTVTIKVALQRTGTDGSQFTLPVCVCVCIYC